MTIQVISARSGYESLFPNDTMKWKIEAFLKLKENYDSSVFKILFWVFYFKIITNIICLGDSIIEIDAAHMLGKSLLNLNNYIFIVKKIIQTIFNKNY